ncbi:hypothetical protein INS49_005751 [Diaporthe citri]|uniref:uncharacterized protein n=1 Tax=Diaporthe citri TaxID=83186 RepID=UPI001C7FBEF3|nr:uncharacterized protein INS49_005751 [Diaporthe citri]KAG6364153.1 hypothetical protein INS49_005751 [Diaporthe citri]
MKVPENSVLAVDYGFQEYGLRLHELDIKLHTNADKSLSPRKAFLSHDATGARTTAQAGRWSQNDGRDTIGTMLVTKGINLEKNDYASTFQATRTNVPGLESLLFDYDRSTWVGKDGSATTPQLRPEVYEGSTFQLDVSQPGDAFARMLAWLRYNDFNDLQVIIKGYNRSYSDDPALVKAVNSSFSFRTGALIDTFRAHNGAVLSAACSLSHMKIATGSRDKTVRIWNLHTSTLEGTLVGHTSGAVNSVAFSYDNPWVVSGSEDNTARVWNFRTGKLLQVLKSHKGAVTSVVFSDRNSMVASASDDGKVILWSVAVVSTSDETIRIWQAETGKLQRTVQGHTAAVTSTTFGEVGGKRAIITTSSDGERLQVLDYGCLENAAMDQIKSFIDNPIPEFGQIIPEIVHCGLGLHYDTRRGTAVNPKDGSPISDPELLLASRLDRAMIEVSLELKKLYPRMIFSSCTRLSDVYYGHSDAEYTADLLTGSLKPKPTGQQGIPARLRAIHGGMHPQSDLVVADDPMAEIAARTWIDEYARLDRTQLMNMTYDAWIAQNPKVKEVVDGLNVKFWPNTVGGTPGGAQKQQGFVPAAKSQKPSSAQKLGGAQKQEGIVPAAESQGYRKPRIVTEDEVNRGLQRALKETEGKRKWWKKS